MSSNAEVTEATADRLRFGPGLGATEVWLRLSRAIRTDAATRTEDDLIVVTAPAGSGLEIDFAAP